MSTEATQRPSAKLYRTGFCYLGLLVVLAVLAGQRVAPVIVLAVAVVLAGVAWRWQHLLAERRSAQERAAHEQPLFWVAVGVIVVGALSLLLWWRSGEHIGVAFVGGIVVYLGFGQVIAELRDASRPAPWVAGPVLLVSASAAIWQGVANLDDDTIAPARLLVAVAGLLLIPPAMSLSTELVVLGLDANRQIRVSLVIVGAVAVVAACGLLLQYHVSLLWVGALAVLLGLLVGAVASNTPIDVFVAVALVAVSWASAAKSVPPTNPPRAGNDMVLVALGDSYMSGEGAREFFDGTNVPGSNTCRRAPTAYAARLVQDAPELVSSHLAAIACSGALTRDVTDDPQHPGEPLDADRPSDASPGGMAQLPNLDQQERKYGFRVKLILISIGGNDAGFSDIGIACAAPRECRDIKGGWFGNLPNVGDAVEATLRRVRAVVAERYPDAAVVAVPYPVPLSAKACGSVWLSADEHAFLIQFVNELNGEIRDAASHAGVWYMDTMPDALATRHLRLCDTWRPGAHFVGLGAVSGLFADRVNPANWLHNSFHPNARGHQAMETTALKWLQDHREGLASGNRDLKPSKPQLGTPIVHTPCSVTDIDPSTDCTVKARNVALDNTVEMLRTKGLLVPLLGTGLWLLWMTGISRHRRIRQ